MKTGYDVVIIGRGIAGYAAAIYCGRLGLKSIIIGNEPGGTLVNASLVENYPGFSKISGKGLIKKVIDHSKNYNTEILEELVEKISKVKDVFEVYTKKKKIISKTIIFCTGSQWKKLGVIGEKEFVNKGVHYCALCDGFFYKEKTVAVIGGGDSAVKEGLLLSKYAKKVYIISRSKLNPEPINFDRVKAEKKIEIIEGTSVKEIKGNEFVEPLVLSNSRLLNVSFDFTSYGPENLALSGLSCVGNKINTLLPDLKFLA